jgi:hypothetical protein
MTTATQKKQNVVLRESEIQDFLIRYPGLGRMDVLVAIVRAGPRRATIDAEIAKLWGKLVLSSGRYLR